MNFDVIIIGAGASGLMCAMEAGRRGRKVIVIDHNTCAGQKIIVSGGGYCNFTNRKVSAENYLSANAHFAKSALARFAPEDFTAFLDRHGIRYFEKDAGQMFCESRARQIVDALVEECKIAGVNFMLGTKVLSVVKKDRFIVDCDTGQFESTSLVIATGGLSYEKLGASNFGHKIAKQFGLSVIKPGPALVPFLFDGQTKSHFGKLAGVSLEVKASCNGKTFRGGMLFTHNGLSGPAILQISSFWTGGDLIRIDLFPDVDIETALLGEKMKGSKAMLKTFLARYLTKNFADAWCDSFASARALVSHSEKELGKIASQLHDWEIKPAGTEGYATAEVTRGGVDTSEISSKTMEARNMPGLFFTGEVLDVTGELGGYNLHWAWASGHAAGKAV